MSSLLAASSTVSSAAASSAASAAATMASISTQSHEVALVAPRPVRMTHAAYFHLQREPDYSYDPAGSGSQSSTAGGITLTTFSSIPERSSSRSSLSSEALEEFLSILTPSFMRKPRAFPAFDPRHQRTSSLTTTTTTTTATTTTTTAYGYNRGSQKSTSPVASRASPPALQLLQEQLAARGDGARTPSRLEANWPFGGRSHNATILASPVSRMHTRNPFYLHHDSPGAGARFPLAHPPYLPPVSPSPSRGGKSEKSETPAASAMTMMQPRTRTPVAPHAVPLPTPSPDELSERFELSSI